MWLRWRRSKYTLHPWDYMTNNTVYADDMIDMERLETMAKHIEREIEKRQDRRNQLGLDE